MHAIKSQTFFRRDRPPGAGAPICVRRNKAAEMLDISVSTLDRLVKAGDIPCFKLASGVLFRVQALQDWAHQQELHAARGSVNSDIVPKPATSSESTAATSRR